MEVWWILNEIVFATDPGNPDGIRRTTDRDRRRFRLHRRTDSDLSHGYSGAGHAVCLHTESAPKAEKAAFENHCFVFKAKPSQLQCHHALHGILLDENTDLNEVVNRLITLFTQFHAFEFAIKEASLERRGYEPFFEIAKKAFPHCLIVVTDSAYNIVCSTRSSVDDIPYFRDLLQRGYYSREDMNQIASWGYYEDERKCVQPVLYPAEKTICGYPFLVRSYKNHGAAYCFIGCYFPMCRRRSATSRSTPA